MIFVSWNCKGLANKPKKLALKEMVVCYNPDILLLQDTLGKSTEVETTLSSILPGWLFLAVDSIRHSGGLAMGFREGRLQIFNHWGMAHVIGMEFQSLEFGFPLSILNIYGPCQGRVKFWTDLLSKSMLKSQNLTIGGDLNFSMGKAEAWGPSAREDQLSEFFLNSLCAHNLIDISPIKLKPTWRNRRAGDERIAKRLDRFLICEDLTSRIPMFRQWVGEGGNSNHFPVLLEISKPPHKPAAPFKFNALWLKEESYNRLFRET